MLSELAIFIGFITMKHSQIATGVHGRYRRSLDQAAKTTAVNEHNNARADVSPNPITTLGNVVSAYSSSHIVQIMDFLGISQWILQGKIWNMHTILN